MENWWFAGEREREKKMAKNNSKVEEGAEEEEENNFEPKIYLDLFHGSIDLNVLVYIYTVIASVTWMSLFCILTEKKTN